MALRKYKPTSPGRRFRSVSGFEDVAKKKPEKSLVEPVKRKGGRNNQGRITTRHQGGGHKRRYRRIDFKRVKDGVPAKVASIEYDPNRSARIALLHYADGAKSYILAPAGLRVGATVEAGPGADIRPGNALPLANVDRLEEFTRDRVERIGHQDVVQYRSGLLPLVDKVVSVFTSRDPAVSEPGEEACDLVCNVLGDFELLLERHIVVWHHLWERARVHLGTDGEIARLLRRG